MARNSTTFPAGNGPGYGGPKKSAGKAPGSAGSGRKKGVKLTETKAAKKRETFQEILAPHTESFAEKWREIALQDGHPHQHTMILKAAEAQGAFKQVVEHAGNVGFVIYGEREAESVEEWQAKHQK